MGKSFTLENDPNVCIETKLHGLCLLRRGKVRDVYEFGDMLLMIATDRISAFDVVLPTPIPMKGAVLTQLSRFWFDMFRDTVPNHLVTADVDDFPDELQPHREVLRFRGMLTLKAEMFPGRSTANPGASAESNCLPGFGNATSCPNHCSPLPRRPRKATISTFPSRKWSGLSGKKLRTS